MADRLKDHFSEDVPIEIARMIHAVDPGFPSESFVARALDGYAELELMQRAKHIAHALADHLPTDRSQAIRILTESLGSPIADAEQLDGMLSFIYMPHVFFVAEYGLECFDRSMTAQYELTKRFTAEFSIRAFIERHPHETLSRLESWTRDPDPHVRRLVSEGTRPRLPWAPRLRQFIDDPNPVIELLDRLVGDESLYVRRSVANNLNDISKDHPTLAVSTARRWAEDGADPYVIRHGLRTLVKRGDPAALGVLGYDYGSPAAITVTCSEPSVPIGHKVRVTTEIHNPTSEPIDVLVDLIVHFVKASGASSPKVFKGGEFHLEPGGRTAFRKSVSAAVHTTRRPYPGLHTIDALVNGEQRLGASRFEITE